MSTTPASKSLGSPPPLGLEFPVNIGVAAVCLNPSYNSENIENPYCNEVPGVDTDTGMISSFAGSVGKILSCFCHAREVA